MVAAYARCGNPPRSSPFIDRLTFYLGDVNALNWQHLDAVRNIEASAAIMRGDAEPMRKMLDTLVTDEPS